MRVWKTVRRFCSSSLAISERPLPLAGVRVLDLSRVLAAPLCTQNLSDLGAEVIKIEHPTHGDETRLWQPPQIHGQSAYFMCCNRNKQW